MTDKKVMLITGAAQRIGAYLAQAAHADGYNIALHYRHSAQQTQEIKSRLNAIRENSCICIQADFNQDASISKIVEQVTRTFNRLDVLVNNASEFFPTQLSQLSTDDYDKLFNSNVKGPLFLSKACIPLLKKSKGTIINLVDIHADKPLKNHPVYSMAKAANKMMVQSLAKELAPEIRVNGIAPGCIFWPEKGATEKEKSTIIKRSLLHRIGDAQNIYQSLQYLINNDFVTGQTIKVDGGRSLNM
jgi:pteridine reductase